MMHIESTKLRALVDSGDKATAVLEDKEYDKSSFRFTN